MGSERVVFVLFAKIEIFETASFDQSLSQKLLLISAKLLSTNIRKNITINHSLHTFKYSKTIENFTFPLSIFSFSIIFSPTLSFLVLFCLDKIEDSLSNFTLFSLITDICLLNEFFSVSGFIFLINS